MSGKVTHIDFVRGQYAYNRKQVLWLTGITEDELNNLIYETGEAWITAHIGNDQEMASYLLAQEEIWNWWKNEWHRRDACNLPALYDIYQRHPGECKGRYRMLHQETFVRYSLPYTLLENSYCRAIGALNENARKHNRI